MSQSLSLSIIYQDAIILMVVSIPTIIICLSGLKNEMYDKKYSLGYYWFFLILLVIAVILLGISAQVVSDNNKS